MPFLDATSSEIERQGYIKYLSEELGVSEEQIIGDYAKQKIREPVKVEERPVSKSRNLLNISRDLNAMLFLMNNRSEFEKFRQSVRINLLNDRDAQSLYAVLENAAREEISDTDLILQMIEDQDLKNLVVQSFDSSLYKVSNPDEAVKEAITAVRLEELLEKRRRVQGMVNSAAVEGITDSQLIELMETLRDLDNEIIAFQNG
jgi:DNA primase